jgi:hypothetical protein
MQQDAGHITSQCYGSRSSHINEARSASRLSESGSNSYPDPDHGFFYENEKYFGIKNRPTKDIQDKGEDSSPTENSSNMYSGRGKFMPLPLKSKILETPGSLVTDGIKMFPL